MILRQRIETITQGVRQELYVYLRQNRLVLFLSLSLSLSLFCFPSFAWAELRLKDVTLPFDHYAYDIDDNNYYIGANFKKRVVSKLHAKVIENKYLRVTLVPDYGGRILSIIYRPTGRELLYRNPIGTPFQTGMDPFYYRYMVILGGIFPSFPEANYGKMWPLAWGFYRAAS